MRNLLFVLVALSASSANAFSPDGHSALEPVQYPYPPGVYGPLPVPGMPPGMRPFPNRNYWEFQPYPFPQTGGRWRFHGEPDPYYPREGSRGRMYEEFCAWGGRCR